MNSMKTLLAGLLAAAAVAPASAAYVQIDWTGGGVTFSGQLQLGSVTAGTPVDQNTAGLGNLTITANDGADLFAPASIVVPQSEFATQLQFSFNLAGSTATKTGGSEWILGDAFFANYLTGTVGSSNWEIVGNGDSAQTLSGQADTLVLTVVPEPELMAGVAALGLVSFALIRRRVA
jgi:hypothetical protein